MAKGGVAAGAASGCDLLDLKVGRSEKIAGPFHLYA